MNIYRKGIIKLLLDSAHFVWLCVEIIDYVPEWWVLNHQITCVDYSWSKYHHLNSISIAIGNATEQNSCELSTQPPYHVIQHVLIFHGLKLCLKL